MELDTNGNIVWQNMLGGDQAETYAWYASGHRELALSPDGTKSTNASRAANTKGIDTTILKIPDDRGVVLPGTYYLFALDNRGTPSIASMINIQ